MKQTIAHFQDILNHNYISSSKVTSILLEGEYCLLVELHREGSVPCIFADLRLLERTCSEIYLNIPPCEQKKEVKCKKQLFLQHFIYTNSYSHPNLVCKTFEGGKQQYLVYLVIFFLLYNMLLMVKQVTIVQLVSLASLVTNQNRTL